MLPMIRALTTLCFFALLAGCMGAELEVDEPATGAPVDAADWDADESADPWQLDPDGSADEERGNDGDGWSIADGDCDDDDPSVYPGAPEYSNDGIDQNCNGFDTIRCYVDGDGDGYGAAFGFFEGNGLGCGVGFSELDGDCEDSQPDGYPGAPEFCDEFDQDCDGDLVENFGDADGDGLPDCVGDPEDNVDGDAFTIGEGDCNDNDPTVYPGASETANDGIDQNCNGVDTVRCYTDNDNDLVGDVIAYFEGNGVACISGTAFLGGDCDDSDADIYPDAPDVCDAIDQDCDGDLVEGFTDANGDGVPECGPPADEDGDGMTGPEGDCDDSDPTIYTGAPEYANDGIDQNCNGFDTIRCYDDDDGDGFGGSVAYFEGNGLACSNSVPDGGDCDDSDVAFAPGAAELCDEIDHDCDGDLVDQFDDIDGDGLPDCDIDPDVDDDGDGFSINDGDCNDFEETIYPGAPEFSNDGIDQNCNGSDTIRCYSDDDADGFGDTLAYFEGNGLGCAELETALDGDCDDLDAAIHPEAHDACDEIDQDCDGDLVEDYLDPDGDGVPDCEAVDGDADADGWLVSDGDCDDSDDTVYPGAPEYANDGIDQNCNGFDTIRCYTDGDSDFWGGALAYFEGNGASCSSGTTANSGDCDDADAGISPAANELCDAIDSDCDGDLVDNFDDADGDGVPECGDPDVDDDGDGFTANEGDCDDFEETVYPGAPEFSNDGIDQNCNGYDTIRCYTDDDGDGWGDALAFFEGNGVGCGDASTVSGDCDDGAIGTNPEAHDSCDGIDQDCDGDLVEGYADADGDGVPECADDADADGWLASDGDCNDSDDSIHPGASEVANDGIDQDCNGWDTIRCYDDLDFDLWGDTVAYFDNTGGGCVGATSPEGGDCDDTDSLVNPDGNEVCDAIDSDCDGDLVDGYPDANGDGVPECPGPNDDDDGDGFTGSQGDCDDLDPSAYPGAPEYSNDGIDQNCNGYDTVRCYLDDDGDGVGDGLSYFEGNGNGCDSLSSQLDGDCDDADPTVSPISAEMCDAFDQDCDGDILENFEDADGNGIPDCAEGP